MLTCQLKFAQHASGRAVFSIPSWVGGYARSQGYGGLSPAARRRTTANIRDLWDVCDNNISGFTCSHFGASALGRRTFVHPKAETSGVYFGVFIQMPIGEHQVYVISPLRAVPVLFFPVLNLGQAPATHCILVVPSTFQRIVSFAVVIAILSSKMFALHFLLLKPLCGAN